MPVTDLPLRVQNFKPKATQGELDRTEAAFVNVAKRVALRILSSWNAGSVMRREFGAPPIPGMQMAGAFVFLVTSMFSIGWRRAQQEIAAGRALAPLRFADTSDPMPDASEFIRKQADRAAMGFLKMISQKARDIVNRVIVEEGGSVQDAMKALRLEFPTWTKTQLELTARTVSNYTFNAARLESFVQNGMPAVEISAILDSRICARCRGLDGIIMPLPPVEGVTFIPPFHWSCFPAGTEVSAPSVLRTFARWYEGELVEVKTAGGRVLSGTPNHPVLTTSGWIALGLLNETHHLICSSNAERSVQLVDPNEHQVPAPIEDVAVPAGCSVPVGARCVPVASQDFHGDGANSEVCVIRTNRLLRDDDQASVSQPLDHTMLITRLLNRLASLPRKGGFAQNFKGWLSSASRLVCRTGIPRMLFPRSPGHHQPVGFKTTANSYALFEQASPNSVSLDPEVSCQGRLAFASNIAPGNFLNGKSELAPGNTAVLLADDCVAFCDRTKKAASAELIAEVLAADVVTSGDNLNAFTSSVIMDRVVNVSKCAFKGHVYNLETSTGWYFANGVIVHNCRCVALPVLEDDPDLDKMVTTAEALQKAADRNMQGLMIGNVLVKKWPGVLKGFGAAETITPAPAVHASYSIGEFVAVDAPLQPFAMEVFAAIDSVITLGVAPRGMRKILFRAEPMWPGQYGYFDGAQVAISTAAPHPIMTAVHELGHFLDARFMGAPEGRLARRGSRMASGGRKPDPTGPLATWWKAVTESEHYKALVALYSDPSLKLHQRKFIEYLLFPAELWARSFAQFVATRTRGNPFTQADWKSMRSEVAWPGSRMRKQFSVKDFGPVEAAMEQLFIDRGWLKSTP